MLNKISRLCLLAAVGLLIWAGSWMIVFRDTPPNREALIVEALEQDIGQQELGTLTLELHVFNVDDQPHRIIGIEGG